MLLKDAFGRLFFARILCPETRPYPVYASMSFIIVIPRRPESRASTAPFTTVNRYLHIPAPPPFPRWEKVAVREVIPHRSEVILPKREVKLG